MKKGEITAFLSLIFLLVLSLAGAMIESASIQVLKNNKCADMNLAFESVFAEYQKELLEEYDIFSLDGAYGVGEFGEDKVLRRLEYYGGESGVSNVEKSEFLTDSSGQPFYEQAVRYMENKLGIDKIMNEKEEVSSWEEQEEDGKQSEREESRVQEELESMLGEAGEELPEADNPIQSVSNIRTSNLLQFIVSDAEQLSNKSIRKEMLPSGRKLNQGKGKFEKSSSQSGAAGKLFFQEYLMEHFSDVTQEEQGKSLDYELEYLISGHEEDRMNLEEVLKKILAVRFGLNYAYLLTDEAKKAEAEAMALGLCTLLTVPGITEVVKQAVLLAWAYGESLVDVRSLVRGNKVPAIKNAENWQLDLSGVLTLGSGSEEAGQQESEEGMSYQDYLRGMLLLEGKEKLAMRALDLIESNLDVKADGCVTRLEIKSVCPLRRGIQYEFSTYFGYQ